MTQAPWFALRIPPQKEQAAHEILTSRGFTSFFAHEVREVARHRHRSKTRELKTFPLLHGYALAEHDGSPDWWHRILSLQVVKGVIGVGGRPLPIRRWAIDRLARRSGATRLLPSPKPISAGQMARLLDGPFAGHTGRVVECRGAKARLLLGLLGSEREAEVEIRSLEAA